LEQPAKPTQIIIARSRSSATEPDGIAVFIVATAPADAVVRPPWRCRSPYDGSACSADDAASDGAAGAACCQASDDGSGSGPDQTTGNSAIPGVVCVATGKRSGQGNTDKQRFHWTVSSVSNDHVSKARDQITDRRPTCTLPMISKSPVPALASETAEPNQWRAYGNGHSRNDLDQSVQPLLCEAVAMKYPTKPIWTALAAGAICIFGVQSFSHAMPADAQRPDNRESARVGRDVAKRYCAGCHAIGRTGSSPNPKAPRFALIAELYPDNNPANVLTDGTVIRHPGMPEFRMLPAETDGLVAYLRRISRQWNLRR
jgi:mono/diheme cytochrome c family protein